MGSHRPSGWGGRLEVGRWFGWPHCRMSRLKYAHFCKWHFSRTALSLIDIIWWNLCTDTKAKASSALNSMGNRYFSCLKTPFGRLYYHSCCCCWVPFCGLSTRHGPSRPMSVLLSVLRCQPSAIRRLLSAVCRLPSVAIWGCPLCGIQLCFDRLSSCQLRWG